MPFKQREGETDEEYEARKSARPPRGTSASIPRGDSPPRSTGPKSMAGEIHPAIAGPNDILRMLPWTQEDALEPNEVEALVDALDKQQQVSPRFRRGLKKFTKASAGANIYVCLAMIALPRLERHGLIPGHVLEAMRREAAEYQAKVQSESEALQYEYDHPQGPPAVHGVNSHTGVPVEA